MQETKIFSTVRKLISANKITDAKITLQPLIARNYKNTSLHLLLGIIHHLENNFEKASISYKKSLELDPENVEALLNFSVLYFDIGKHDEAKDLYTRAATIRLEQKEDKIETQSIDSILARQHLELSKLYLRYKRYDEAEQEVKKATSLDTKLEEAGLIRAECLFEKGEPEKAILFLSRLVNKNPAYLDLRIKLGLYFHKLGDTVSAISEWEKVLREDSQNIEAKHFLNTYEESSPTL